MAQLLLQNGVTQATPAAGTLSIYSKTADKRLYYKDDAGVEIGPLGGGGGAGTVTSVTSANADLTVATGTTTPVITAVQAPALRSATTTVDVSSATAPTVGQVLTATSGTAATWQTPTSGGAGTVTSVTSANANLTVATGTTTPVLTIVQAPALQSATTSVSVAAATAPVAGQVLTATSGTAATWQTPTGGVGALPSMVQLNTGNGYGSTNTMIRRFTNVVTNQGTDITYADSATLGATFTINTNGVYAISFTDCLSSASHIGLSLNSSQLTTSILAVTAADQLAAATTGGANFRACVSVTAFFASGSVIRAHCQGTTDGIYPALFTIMRVA